MSSDPSRSDSPVSSIVSEPPHYSRHNRPDIPITYSLNNLGNDAMILVPRNFVGFPSYRISVSLDLNPLLPISFVTKVEMTLPESGQEDVFVGEFELSLHQTRGVLIMDVNPPARLSNVLTSNGSRGHWLWTWNNIQLRWNCNIRLDDGSPMCVCYGSLDQQLATFVPPPFLAPPPLPPAIFTVFPDGHEYFEHILMSILIVQRKMTMFL